MFEGGVLSCDRAGDAVGGVGAPVAFTVPPTASGGEPTASVVPLVSVEDATGLLGSLAGGGVLASVVEGLLARLLIPAQNDDEDAQDCGGGGDSGGVPGAESLLTDEEAGTPASDTALVAAGEKVRMVGGEEVGETGLMALGAEGLGELVAACRRLAAWASWGEALAAACLTGCPELSAHPGQWGPDGTVSPVVGYEERRFNTTCLLSARLGVSRSRAGQIIDHGHALMDVGYGPTEVMERSGVLDAAKASLVTRRLEGVPTLVALGVQERVLPQAPRRSVSQVGRDLDRALMEIDPEGHAERARANTARRYVSRPRLAGEGISQIRMLLPTMDALLLDATLDAIAASARAAGEERSLGQLRADAITAMTLQALRTSQQTAFSRPTSRRTDQPALKGSGRPGGDQVGANCSKARASLPVIPADPPVDLPVGLPAGSSCSQESWGPSDTACSRGRANSVPGAPVPARLLPDGVPLEGLLRALSGLVDSTSPWWTPSGTGHLPLPAGIHVDVQVAVPLTSLAPPGEPTVGNLRGNDPGGGSEQHQNHAEGNGDAVRTDAPDSAGRTLPTSSGGSLPSTGLHLSAEAPAGLTETVQPAEVAGFVEPVGVARPAKVTEFAEPADVAQVAEVRVGSRSVAVPALIAWALAAGGTWRRLVTDPVSGTMVDVGRTRYRPPAGLADLVRARDRVCVFPTCQTPASRCDIDHLTPWGEGGTTSLDNLATLCEAHHRLKHTPGWALTRDNTTGVLWWHTPDKAVYQCHPDGTINRLPMRVGPRQRYVPATVVPTSLSEITAGLIDRLNTALDNTSGAGHGGGTHGGSHRTARITTHGPRPGQRAGAYETTPYPDAAHTLGLAPLIDTAPPF